MSDIIISKFKMKERIADLDIIRGYAIFGILTCNIVALNYPMEYFSQYFSEHNSWTDQIFEFIRFSYFGDRTYTIFALLFGIGIGIQFLKFENNPKSFIPYQFTRMTILFIIGIVHATIIWFGDILMIYAVLGILSIIIVRLTTRQLLILSIILFFWPTVQYFLIKNELIDLNFHSQEPLALQKIIALNTTSGFDGHLDYNLSQFFPTLQYYISAVFYKSFSMMTFGILCTKLNFHKTISSDLKRYKQTLLTTVPIILIWTVYLLFFFQPGKMSPNEIHFFLFLSPISVLAQTFFVISLIVIINRKNNLLNRLLGSLRYLGRMSLTNYLSQSLIGLIVFKGFGLYGKSNPSIDFIVTILFVILQIFISKWWINKYNQGPIEQFWRKLTKWTLNRTAI